MMTLTGRQKQVMEGLARGESRKEIAAALGISPATASVYVRDARHKFHIGTTAALLVTLTQLGLIGVKG